MKYTKWKVTLLTTLISYMMKYLTFYQSVGLNRSRMQNKVAYCESHQIQDML